MSKKSYQGVEYLAQSVQSSMRGVIQEKFGGLVQVKHTINSEKGTHSVYYSVMDSEVHVDFSEGSNPDQFNMDVEVKCGGNRHSYNDIFVLDRSKNGRLSERFTKGLARDIFNFFKETYRSQNLNSK